MQSKRFDSQEGPKPGRKKVDGAGDDLVKVEEKNARMDISRLSRIWGKLLRTWIYRL